MSRPTYHAILRRHPRMLRRGEIFRHILVGSLILMAVALLHHLSRSFWCDALIGLILAIFTFRAFGIMHECVHSALVKSPSVNSAVGFICGVFCFLPFSGWRDMHLEHHRWTGSLDRDPTTKILLQFERAGFAMPASVTWAWCLWVPLLGLMQHVVFWRATLRGREYRFFGCVLGYVGLMIWVAGPIGLACGLVSYLVLVEAVNLPHHLGMAQERGEIKIPLSEQNRFTRSCVYPKWMAHFVLLNFNLHTAHHLFPSHPWYQLDALHQDLCASGLQLNLGTANGWTWRKRKVSLNMVLLESFADRSARSKRVG